METRWHFSFYMWEQEPLILNATKDYIVITVQSDKKYDMN